MNSSVLEHNGQNLFLHFHLGEEFDPIEIQGPICSIHHEFNKFVTWVYLPLIIHLNKCN